MKTKTKSKQAQARKAKAVAQPALAVGLYVECMVDGFGPHYGTVMEIGKWGVLVRIDDDDRHLAGKPVVIDAGSDNTVLIVPRQTMERQAIEGGAE